MQGQMGNLYGELINLWLTWQSRKFQPQKLMPPQHTCANALESTKVKGIAKALKASDMHTYVILYSRKLSREKTFADR